MHLYITQLIWVQLIYKYGAIMTHNTHIFVTIVVAFYVCYFTIILDVKYD